MHKTIVQVLLRCDGAFLLVKQAYGGHFWTLPGGVVEPGETLAEAVVREVREETGLETRVQGLVSLRDRADQTCFVFTIEVCGGSLIEHLPGEIEAVRWFDRAEFEAAGQTIEQFPQILIRRAFQSGLTLLEIQPWQGYAAPADWFV